MAAASAARNTRSRGQLKTIRSLIAAATFWQGTLAARDASGTVVPASDTAGLKVIGVFQNSGVSGDRAHIATGTFHFANGASFTAAHTGDKCYVEFDNEVQTAAAATNDIPAGTIEEVDSEGVWVNTDHAVLC